MKQLLIQLVFIVCIGALAGCVQSSNVLTSEKSAGAELNPVTAANKQKALNFYRPGITIAERDAMIHPDYIQHHPGALKFGRQQGLTAKEVFPLWMARIAAAIEARPVPVGPQPPPGKQAYMAIAEGDKVFLMHQRFAQDPNEPPGTFYEYFSWGMFGFKDGLIYEHWDGNTIPAE